MKFQAKITIMPRPELLDPQGKTVQKNLPNIGILSIDEVRIGKFISMNIEAADLSEAEKTVESACSKMLANIIMESYEYEILPAQQ